MDEQIKINYETVEELFSRKTEVAVVKETDTKKKTEVSVVFTEYKQNLWH